MQQRNSNSSTTSAYAGYQNFIKLLQMTVQHLCNPISFLKIYPMRCTVDLNRLPPASSTYFGTNSVRFKTCLVWHRLISSSEKSRSVSEFGKKFKTISNTDCSRVICGGL